MFFVISFVLVMVLIASVSSSVTADNKLVASDTATEMYLYGWPLVMSSLTRKSMLYLPPNIMLPLPVFPNPNLTAIVKPNVDTLYDASWIDHGRAEDLVLKIPDTSNGLYYLFPLMDAWTNIVGSPGWRTTGKGAQEILIRGPFSTKPDPVEGEYGMFIKSTTNMAYLLGRTNVADQTNLTPTQQQLFSYKLTHDSTTIKDAKSDVEKKEKLTPKEQIFAMSARDFFNSFAELLITNPPILPQDTEIVAKMEKEFGLVAGQPWEYSQLSAAQKQQLTNGVTSGLDFLTNYPIARSNGWKLPDLNTGKYGDNYHLRAYIALVLYAANVPQDAVYFETDILQGGGKEYELLVSPETGGLPPTSAFWSLTMYSDQGYLVPNENGTYSVSSQQNLKYLPDGSLHITISVTPPNADDVSKTNWLPAPQQGEDFQLTLRVYWPGDAVLNGSYVPPKVTEIVAKHSLVKM